jgi:hypothetical protein
MMSSGSFVSGCSLCSKSFRRACARHPARSRWPGLVSALYPVNWIRRAARQALAAGASVPVLSTCRHWLGRCSSADRSSCRRRMRRRTCSRSVPHCRTRMRRAASRLGHPPLYRRRGRPMQSPKVHRPRPGHRSRIPSGRLRTLPSTRRRRCCHCPYPSVTRHRVEDSTVMRLCVVHLPRVQRRSIG